jgi:hypothetical protein
MKQFIKYNLTYNKKLFVNIACNLAMLGACLLMGLGLALAFSL